MNRLGRPVSQSSRWLWSDYIMAADSTDEKSRSVHPRRIEKRSAVEPMSGLVRPLLLALPYGSALSLGGPEARIVARDRLGAFMRLRTPLAVLIGDCRPDTESSEFTD